MGVCFLLYFFLRSRLLVLLIDADIWYGELGAHCVIMFTKLVYYCLQ